MQNRFQRANGCAVSNVSSVAPILIIESNAVDAYFAAVAMETAGFKTITASNGEQALQLAQEQPPLFVILDVMLQPAMDGWDVCRELRRASEVPILILTKRGAPSEQIKGLSLGADDYVVKPCSAGELVARVGAILRRTRPQLEKDNSKLSHQGLVLDALKRRVTLHGHDVSLTCFEYKLLHALMLDAGRIFLREELLNHLYAGGEAVIDRVIDVHIGNLRRKIEDDPAHPRFVLTARGLGYHFADDDVGSSNEMTAPVEQDFRQLFENAITGIYETTLGGRYLKANPMLAGMFGYESSSEMVESTVDLNDGFYVERGRRAEFAELIRSQGAVRGFESEVYRSDGSVIWISEHSLAVNDAAGKLIGFQGTTIDVTERKQEETSRSHLDPASDFSSGTIH